MRKQGGTPYLVRVPGSGAASIRNSDPTHAAARWQRVKEILDYALEAPAGQRDRVVEELCDGDVSLCNEVHEYLTYSDRAEDLLDRKSVV